ncbi:hypothetical protein HK096_011016 [Nowakowskiella sp. JEL0078]|nr:hypothetical protein HK096_011016 [Nowakowskiella sp. JEL0078]
MFVSLGLILLAVLLWKTRPALIANTIVSTDTISFRSFLSASLENSPNPTPQGLFRAISSFFSSPVLPDFKVVDYFFCSIATIDTGASFLGIFGTWFPLGDSTNLPTSVTSSSGYSSVRVNISESSESAKELAAKYRLAGQHALAANSYINAARILEADPSDIQQHEAAIAYENGSKEFTQAQMFQDSTNAVRKAIAIFSRNERTLSRAGRLLDGLAQKLRRQNELESALDSYRQAKTLFQQTGDHRYRQMISCEADICGELNRFHEAFRLYEEVCIK